MIAEMPYRPKKKRENSIDIVHDEADLAAVLRWSQQITSFRFGIAPHERTHPASAYLEWLHMFHVII